MSMVPFAGALINPLGNCHCDRETVVDILCLKSNKLLARLTLERFFNKSGLTTFSLRLNVCTKSKTQTLFIRLRSSFPLTMNLSYAQSGFTRVVSASSGIYQWYDLSVTSLSLLFWLVDNFLQSAFISPSIKRSYINVSVCVCYAYVSSSSTSAFWSSIVKRFHFRKNSLRFNVAINNCKFEISLNILINMNTFLLQQVQFQCNRAGDQKAMSY